MSAEWGQRVQKRVGDTECRRGSVSAEGVTPCRRGSVSAEGVSDSECRIGR